VRYSAEEIQLAHELKAAGLPWQPEPGHFVWDGEPLIEHDSPFHDRVFFILDLKHFLRRSESMERLIASMVWLPTWQQARELLAGMDVSADAIQSRLIESNALANGNERLVLYQMLMEALPERS
jgi:hypothetical protein